MVTRSTIKKMNGLLAWNFGGVALLAKTLVVTAAAVVPFSSTEILVLWIIAETKYWLLMFDRLASV